MNSPDPPKRRKYLRFEAHAKVWWSQEWRPQLIWVHNISAGGMLCEFPDALPVASKVQIHFDFKSKGNLVYCDCKVAHCRRTDEGSYLIGLRLVALEGCELSELIEHIKS